MTVTKNIEIFDYKLPVSATAMWNPANKIARIQLDRLSTVLFVA
jgi:hypothetical protein